MSLIDDLEGLRSGIEYGEFSVPFHPVPEQLLAACKDISHKAIREDILAILEDKNPFQDADGNLRCMCKDKGIYPSLALAKRCWTKLQQNLDGPISVSIEFEGMGTAMREVAGRLRNLSLSAREFISMMPDYDMASKECRYQIDLWNEFNASEALPSPFYEDDEKPVLADRLEGIAKIMFSMASEAKNIATNNPGIKHIFNPPPPDLLLFSSCAKLLTRRKRTLKRLRPVAEFFFEYLTQTKPANYWGKRQEEHTRRKFRTDPPNKL